MPVWTWLFPVAALALVAAAGLLGVGTLLAIVSGFSLIGAVLAAVHHAEVVAHRVGEPFGTLILALAVTVIEASLKEGRAIGVTSTPTMFVNGRKLTGSVNWDQLQQIIDFEIEYQKVAKNAGDDCGCVIGAEFPPAQ